MTYQLHHGDCLEILPTLEANSVDAVIADIPYGKTACKWDAVIPFDAMWYEIEYVIKPRAAIVLFGSQPFTSALVMSNPDWFKYRWVWDKKRGRGHLVCNVRPLEQAEDICVFGEAGINYYPQMRLREKPQWSSPEGTRTAIVGGRKHARNGYVSTHAYPTTILSYKPPGKPIHPTQKPVALMEYLVKTYTNEGETVLDFTMGSGSTGVACLNTGRRFIGIEKDAETFEKARKRIEQHTPQLKLPCL